MDTSFGQGTSVGQSRFVTVPTWKNLELRLTRESVHGVGVDGKIWVNVFVNVAIIR